MMGRKGSGYCSFCGEPLKPGEKRPCSRTQASAGRDCSETADILPRSMAPACEGEPCCLCGMPVFPEVYFYQCSHHINGGWCFTEQERKRVIERLVAP